MLVDGKWICLFDRIFYDRFPKTKRKKLKLKKSTINLFYLNSINMWNRQTLLYSKNYLAC